MKIGEIVEMIGMGKEDDCMHDIQVNIKWDAGVLSVPLFQLEGIKPDCSRRRLFFHSFPLASGIR